MSRPIGAHFHVPHGLSNAMLLPAVTDFSLTEGCRRYADCARAMGVCPRSRMPTRWRARGCWRNCWALNQDLERADAAGLRDRRATLEVAAAADGEAGARLGIPANNPRVPTEEEIVSLYRDIYAG